MPTGNAAKTNRIMRGLGFADGESGRYVAALRRLVAERVAKGLTALWPVRGVQPNLSNEECARALLERTR